MSRVTVSLGSARNSSQPHDTGSSTAPRIVKLHSSSGVRGVGPAESTGKSSVTYWPGGTRPESVSGRRPRPRKPREIGLTRAFSYADEPGARLTLPGPSGSTMRSRGAQYGWVTCAAASADDESRARRSPLPQPMLARPDRLPRGDYAYEVKWDGFRAIVSTEAGLQVRSRRGWNMTELVPELAALPSGLVLDGELVAFGDDGRPSFPLLSQRMLHGHRAISVKLMIFDVLRVDGHDVACNA